MFEGFIWFLCFGLAFFAVDELVAYIKRKFDKDWDK